MIEEISESEARKLLAQGYGLFSDKEFKGSKQAGKYIANKKKNWWKCGKLSEAARALGLL